MNSRGHGSEKEEIIVACLGWWGQIQEIFKRWMKVRCQG